MKSKNFHITVQSNNTDFVGFSHMIFFSFWRQEFWFMYHNKDTLIQILYIKDKFLKSFSLLFFTWTLVLVFFSDLVYSWYYRKITVVFFQYLVSFKLNVKLGCCAQSINFPTKHCVACFEAARSCYFRKSENKLNAKENFSKKLWISTSIWQIVKLWY